MYYIPSGVRCPYGTFTQMLACCFHVITHNYSFYFGVVFFLRYYGDSILYSHSYICKVLCNFTNRRPVIPVCDYTRPRMSMHHLMSS